MRYLLTLTTIIFITACGPADDSLEGTWTVSDYETSFPTISPAILAEAEQEARSSIYSFGKEKEFHLSTSVLGPDGVKGEYKYNKETGKLSLTYMYDDNPAKEEYDVESLGGGTLVLKQTIGDLGHLKVTLERQD